MEWLSKETKVLLAEMSVGVILYNLVLCILAFFLMSYLKQPVLPVILGLLVGMVAAIIMLIHMGVTTERVLETQSESYANKNTVVHSLARKFIYVAMLLVMWRVLELNLLAIVIGTMGMKAGAYLQPMVHKIFGHRPKVS